MGKRDSREQAEAIDCLRTENEVLKDKLGADRLLLTDDQRRRLAVKGKILIKPEPDLANATGPIECRERLGGLLRYYHRRAA